jgi:hypothetical protein
MNTHRMSFHGRDGLRANLASRGDQTGRAGSPSRPFQGGRLVRQRRYPRRSARRSDPTADPSRIARTDARRSRKPTVDICERYLLPPRALSSGRHKSEDEDDFRLAGGYPEVTSMPAAASAIMAVANHPNVLR